MHVRIWLRFHHLWDWEPRLLQWSRQPSEKRQTKWPNIKKRILTVNKFLYHLYMFDTYFDFIKSEVVDILHKVQKVDA